MSQNHLKLSFSLKSPADAKVLPEQLPPLMLQLFQAADTIGTIHYLRFTEIRIPGQDRWSDLRDGLADDGRKREWERVRVSPQSLPDRRKKDGKWLIAAMHFSTLTGGSATGTKDIWTSTYATFPLL